MDLPVLMPLNGPSDFTIRAAIEYFLERQPADIMGVSYHLVDGHTPVITIEYRYPAEVGLRVHTAEFWIERDAMGSPGLYGEW